METAPSENIELSEWSEAETETKSDITDSLLPLNEERESVGQTQSSSRSSDHTDCIVPESFSTKKKVNWDTCNEKVFWKCHLWMVITSVFFFFIFLTIISLILYSTVYTEEDDYIALENGSSQYYSGTLRISDECLHSESLSLENKNNAMLSEELTVRLSDVFRTSPALGHYFVSANVSMSENNDVATYQLLFTVPPEDSNFLKYTMSEEFVSSVLRQDVYDQEPTDCKPVLLDPSSVTLSFLRREEWKNI